MYNVEFPEDDQSLVKKVLTKPCEKVLNGTDKSLSTIAVVQEAFKKAMWMGIWPSLLLGLNHGLANDAAFPYICNDNVMTWW